MNILDILKYAKVAWSDKNKVEHLVAQAKVMEGPKPAYKTTEFWINQVIPTAAAIVGGAAAIYTAPALVPWFAILLLGISTAGYLGRTWLKAKTLNAGSLSDPATMEQLTTVVQTVSAAVGAVKDARAGNTAPAIAITETMNAPTIVPPTK